VVGAVLNAGFSSIQYFCHFIFKFYFAPIGGEVLQSSCLSICLYVCLRISKTTFPNLTKFSVCYPWLWLNPPLIAVQYMMYFQFCG